MTKYFVCLLCVLFLSSCSSRLYTVYFDKNPPKSIYHLENISVKDVVNKDNNSVWFNVDMKAYSRRMKYSNEIVKRKVIPKYDYFVDWIGGVVYLAGPIMDIADFVSFGCAFSKPVQKRYIRHKRGFKKVDDDAVLKVSKAPQFGLSLVSLVFPFYTAPFWEDQGLAYPGIKTKDSRVALSSISGVYNDEIVENIPLGGVPLKVYCNGELILDSKCSNSKVYLEEYVENCYKAGDTKLDLKVVVANSDYNINGNKVFNFSYPIKDFLPEEKSLREIITSNVKGANIYAGSDKNNLKMIGKTPYNWESEKKCYAKLNGKYYQLRKPGYIDSHIIYSAAMEEDREINVNLEKIPYGYLNFSSSLNGVKIFVNGEFKITYRKGKYSSLKLQPGSYNIVAKKPGYHDYKREVIVENKGKISLSIDFDKIEYGFLKLTSSLGRAKIFVDNVFKFEMTGAKDKYLKLAEGVHTVKALVDGRIVERKVLIGANGNESVSF